MVGQYLPQTNEKCYSALQFGLWISQISGPGFKRNKSCTRLKRKGATIACYWNLFQEHGASVQLIDSHNIDTIVGETMRTLIVPWQVVFFDKLIL